MTLTPDAHVLRVSGEVDLVSAAELRCAATAILLEEGRLDLDFAGVDFIDSSGLAVLIALTRRCNDPCQLRLLNPRPVVRRALRITCIDSLLDVVE